MTTTKKPTPERELAVRAAADLARREKRTAKALLRTEKRAQGELTEIVQRLTETVASAPMVSASTVRRHLPAAHASIGNGLLRARGAARAAGRERLLEELGREVLGGRDRLLATPLTITAAELDEVAAFVAASSLSASWGQAALSAITADASPMKAAKAVAPNVERTVATEVARAFNDERERLLVDMAAILGGEATPGRPDIPRPGAFKILSAVLDTKTCPRCFAADGEIVELHKPFSVGALPLHPNCRCVVEHIIVAKPERLEDIAIDYDLFKQELRDVIREGRAESERHALGFASESLGPGKRRRSPSTLTKRFAEERYERKDTP